MKRTLTLFLLVLFLLNVLGYYGVFVGIQLNFGKEMRSQFDAENFSSDQEITLQIPISVPYATDAQEFTRVDGEFEYQGETYRLVKQRYAGDTLTIVCVKDAATKEIKQALADYVKSFSDNPSSEKNTSKTLQSFSKDFMPTTTTLQSVNTGWLAAIHTGSWVEDYQSLVPPLHSPPPQV